MMMMMIMFVYSTDDNAQSTLATSDTQGGTIYERVKLAKLLPHTAHNV